MRNNHFCSHMEKISQVIKSIFSELCSFLKIECFCLFRKGFSLKPLKGYIAKNIFEQRFSYKTKIFSIALSLTI